MECIHPGPDFTEELICLEGSLFVILWATNPGAPSIQNASSAIVLDRPGLLRSNRAQKMYCGWSTTAEKYSSFFVAPRHCISRQFQERIILIHGDCSFRNPTNAIPPCLGCGPRKTIMLDPYIAWYRCITGRDSLTIILPIDLSVRLEDK